MAEKKVCDVCGKKINGINVIGYDIEGSTICSSCYEKLDGLRLSKQYKTIDEVNQDYQKYITRIQDLKYPDHVIQSFEKHFNKKRAQTESIMICDNYLITTSDILQGYKITDYLGVVSGQVVIGTGFFSSFNASMADLTGGEADRYTEKINLAHEVAQKRAIYKSIALGGNALIGVDVEHSAFSSDMIAVIVTGTSVKVEKE